MALLGLFMMMGALFMGNLLQDYILDEARDREMRQWMWLHYGTAYRAIYTMLPGSSVEISSEAEV